MQIKRNILLNPGPATTTDTVKMAQVVPDICPREKEFASMMKQMREDLVRIVHGNLNKYTSVLFCGSGTVVMDVCISSLLPEGKKILIINNGTYSMRAVEICEFYNLPFINFDTGRFFQLFSNFFVGDSTEQFSASAAFGLNGNRGCF